MKMKITIPNLPKYYMVKNNGSVVGYNREPEMTSDGFMLICGDCHTGIGTEFKIKPKDFIWKDCEDAEELEEGYFIVETSGKVLYDAIAGEEDQRKAVIGEYKAIINYQENTYFCKYSNEYKPIKLR